jgi:glycosyltransferase involved in cell wall biosynthesis
MRCSAQAEDTPSSGRESPQASSMRNESGSTDVEEIPKVLLLPLHRYVDEQHGAEYIWPLNFANALSKAGVPFVAVVGEVEDLTRPHLKATGTRLIELGSGHNLFSTVDNLRFYFGILRLGLSLDDRKSIVHHVFSLGFNKGFNPYVLLRRPKRLVIGPLLYPVPRSVEAEAEGSYGTAATMQTEHLNELLTRGLSWLHLATLRMASLLIFDSVETKQIYFTKWPALSSITAVIMPTGGVDPNRFPPRRWGPHSDTLQVGTLSHLRPRKRVDVLVKSIGRTNLPGIHLTVGGDGPTRPYLERLAEEVCLPGQVTFVGKVSREDVAGFLRSLDILVLLDPIPHTTMPSVQEALMSGIPVLTSGPSRLNSIVRLPYGYIVTSSNESQVESALRLIYDERSRLPELGAAGRLFAQENFSISAVGSELRAIYGAVARVPRTA